MNNSEIIEKKYAEAVQGIKEEWFQKTNPRWYDYVISLPDTLRITYLIVILHNQVCNGGFHQYFVNGYGQFAGETVKALIDIGAFKKSNLLKEALSIVNSPNHSDRVFREKLLKKEIDALFVDDDLYDPLDNLDSKYYETNDEDTYQLLGDYLQKL